MFYYITEEQKKEFEEKNPYVRYVYEQMLGDKKYYVYQSSNINANFDKSKYIVSNTMYF